jgi:hypothetical protein
LAAFGAVFTRSAWGGGCGRYVFGRRLAARRGTESRNGIEQLATVPQRGNAKFLQVLSCQAGKDCFVYLVLAKSSLILSEAEVYSVVR